VAGRNVVLATNVWGNVDAEIGVTREQKLAAEVHDSVATTVSPGQPTRSSERSWKTIETRFRPESLSIIRGGYIRECFGHFQSVESTDERREVHFCTLPEVKCPLHGSKMAIGALFWQGKSVRKNERS